MFKKNKLLLATITCLTHLSINAVGFYNQSGKRVEFKDIIFTGGTSGHPSVLTLDPEGNFDCSWNLHGIKALTAIFKPENTEERFENLTNRTAITLKADLTHTREDAPRACSVQ